jgi:hypothetical protein
MLAIPEMTGADVAFGNVKHMPKYEAIPEDFKRHNGNEFCSAISKWFFKGAQKAPDGIIIDGKQFTAKPGVDLSKALAAIRAVLGSFEPKHEHKEAACAFMLSEWFDIAPSQEKKRA